MSHLARNIADQLRRQRFPKRLPPIQRRDAIGDAISHLKDARKLLTYAECRQTLKKVRSAIKSAEGALRNAAGDERRQEKQS